jgi:hypothetical protein
VPIGTRPFGRSGQTAITITAILAYSNGFEIFLTRLRRPGAPGFDEDLEPGAPRGKLAGLEPFRFSVEFSDGRTVSHDKPYGRSSGRPHGDAEPVEPILWSRGGGGTSHYSSCGGGYRRCRQVGRWSSSASSEHTNSGVASPRIASLTPRSAVSRLGLTTKAGDSVVASEPPGRALVCSRLLDRRGILGSGRRVQSRHSRSEGRERSERS